MIVASRCVCVCKTLTIYQALYLAPYLYNINLYLISQFLLAVSATVFLILKTRELRHTQRLEAKMTNNIPLDFPTLVLFSPIHFPQHN